MKRCAFCNSKLVKVGEGVWCCPKHSEFNQAGNKTSRHEDKRER